MAKYIKLEDLMQFPIRLDHYDKEHGSKDFIYGIETVLEYAENLPATEIADAPTVEAVPVSELEKLRDHLYAEDLIFMRGLAELNKLIAKYGAKMVDEVIGRRTA